jgi:hypothetical protein
MGHIKYQMKDWFNAVTQNHICVIVMQLCCVGPSVGVVSNVKNWKIKGK